LRKFSRPQAIAMLKKMNVKYVDIKDVHLPLTSTPEEIRPRGRNLRTPD